MTVTSPARFSFGVSVLQRKASARMAFIKTTPQDFSGKNQIFKMLSLQGNVFLMTGLGQTSNEGWGVGAAIATLFARQRAFMIGSNCSMAPAE